MTDSTTRSDKINSNIPLKAETNYITITLSKFAWEGCQTVTIFYDPESANLSQLLRKINTT